MRGGRENLRFLADTMLAERDKWHPLVSTSKKQFAAGRLASSGD